MDRFVLSLFQSDETRGEAVSDDDFQNESVFPRRVTAPGAERKRVKQAKHRVCTATDGCARCPDVNPYDFIHCISHFFQLHALVEFYFCCKLQTFFFFCLTTVTYYCCIYGLYLSPIPHIIPYLHIPCMTRVANKPLIQISGRMLNVSMKLSKARAGRCFRW